MSEAWIKVDDGRLASAADWIVRLQSPDLSDAEVVEFDAWLEAHPANAAAYDRTLSVTLELQDAASTLSKGLAQSSSTEAPARRPLRPAARRGWLVAGGLAAAAAVADRKSTRLNSSHSQI